MASYYRRIFSYCMTGTLTCDIIAIFTGLVIAGEARKSQVYFYLINIANDNVVSRNVDICSSFSVFTLRKYMGARLGQLYGTKLDVAAN